MLHVKPKTTLIMSVVGEGSGRWIDLQREHVSKNTKSFKQVYYCNNIEIDEKKFHVVGKQKTSDEGGKQHFQGLIELLNYAEQNKKKYESFLILDADCFPIADWKKHLTNHRNNAGVIRYENLDTFFHPCVVFFRNPEEVKIQWSQNKNLIGQIEHDTKISFSSPVLPLLRSNSVNLHPVLGAIYSRMFYHHGCGSRRFYIRSNNYWNTFPKYDKSLQLNDIFENTETILELLNEGCERKRHGRILKVFGDQHLCSDTGGKSSSS